MKRLLLFGMAFCSALMNIVSPIHAQTPFKLPADIIFQTWTKPGMAFLVELDAQSLNWHLFYATPGQSVFLIGWSPKGNFLAIFQSGHPCVLTRAGKLLSCMENSVGGLIANAGNGASGDDYLYTITWSDDETKMYYISDQNATPQLIEGDMGGRQSF